MSYPTHDPAPQRIKVAHLVLGLVFLGITAVWALAEAGTVDWHGSRYAVPIILLVAGAAGLIASLAGGRRRPARRTTGADARSVADDAPGTSEDTAVIEPPESTPENAPENTTEIEREDPEAGR